MNHHSAHDQLNALLRGSLTPFLQKVFQEVNPGKPLFDNWHLDALAYALDRCRTGQCKRLVITVPPRSLKSVAASVAFPAFLLGHDPSKRILCVSYADNLALKHASDFRNVMDSKWYRQLFPKTIATRDVEDSFETTQRGVRRSTSFGGSITGFGFDGIIIDDPMKTDETLNKSQREKINDTFSSTLYSRLDRKEEGFIIVVMQRIHDDDLAGYLLKQGGWDQLNLPAIAEHDEDIPVGNGAFHHRTKGEALNPAYESLTSLADTKRTIGTPHFQAQYQQKPVPETGNMIKMEWLKYFEIQPTRAGGRIVQSWDTAMKGEQVNDYSVGTTWLFVNEKHYLIDLVRKQCGYPDLSRLVLDQHAKHRPDALLIEDHGSGCGLIQDLKQLHRINAIAIIPVGDKVTRLSIASPRFEAGEVFLPKDAPWLPDFLDELVRFPQTKFDDQVDCVTQYLIWHRDGRLKASIQLHFV